VQPYTDRSAEGKASNLERRPRRKSILQRKVPHIPCKRARRTLIHEDPEGRSGGHTRHPRIALRQRGLELKWGRRPIKKSPRRVLTAPPRALHADAGTRTSAPIKKRGGGGRRADPVKPSPVVGGKEVSEKRVLDGCRTSARADQSVRCRKIYDLDQGDNQKTIWEKKGRNAIPSQYADNNGFNFRIRPPGDSSGRRGLAK